MKYYSEYISDKGTIAVDDTLLVKGHQTAAGSHILEGYKPLFSAEAVTRLEDAGYAVSGKTHVGEFGLDLVGEFSYYAGKTDTQAASDASGNEKAEPLKGAAAELVAKGEVEAALGVDVNGAPRRAAALSGVSFLKPTYGSVSRYGVVSAAASGEQVGVYAKSAEGVAKFAGLIAGHDEKDGTSLKKDYTFSASEDAKGKKVAIIKELLEKADEATQAKLNAYAGKLKAAGITVEEVSFDIVDIANTTWQILMTAETCNNISRYDGVKYGHRAEGYKNIDELYVKSRTEGFNFLTKAVILYGSDVLSKHRYDDCYGKALKVRRIVAERFASLMEEYDAVLSPACSKAEYAAYDISEAFETVFKESVFTAVANLIGVPAFVNGGVQLMGGHFSENTLLSIAGCAERAGE